MKPVVILTLITDALSGRAKRRLPDTPSDAPISQRQTKREIGVAVAAFVITLALILAIAVSFCSGDP